MADHDQAPENPEDGDEFVCSCCGFTAVYVVFGGQGSWVVAGMKPEG